MYSLPEYLTNNGSFTVPVAVRFKSLRISIEHSKNNKNKLNEIRTIFYLSLKVTHDYELLLKLITVTKIQKCNASLLAQFQLMTDCERILYKL